MHTAQIAKLPIVQTSDAARPDSHGEDFSIHLREDARENARSDKPHAPGRDERCCRNERPRAAEKDHKRISHDDRPDPAKCREKPDQAQASENSAELPASGAEAPDGDAALINAATDPAVTATESPLPEATLTLKVPEADTAEISASTTMLTEGTVSVTGVAAGDQSAQGQGDVPIGKTTETSPALGTADSTPDGEGIVRDPQSAAADGAADPDTQPASQQDPTNAVSANATPAVNAETGAEVLQAPAQAAGPIPSSSMEHTANGQTAAQTTMAATALRSAGTNAVDGTNASQGVTAKPGSEATDADSDAEDIDSPSRKPAAAGTAAPQTAGSANATGANASAAYGASAQPAVDGDAGAGDLPSFEDLAGRTGEAPVQSGHAAQGHNNGASSTAAAFGSDLKLTGEASPAAETAAARNTSNAAANQVAVQINRAVQEGHDKITVNLKPANLGQVSVQLEVGHDNRIIAVISAERPETLELLQRDARTLELALKDAGLKSDSGSLNFSLQGNGSDGTPHDEPSGKDHRFAFSHNGDEPDDYVPSHHPARFLDASGVDIHV